MDQHETDRNEDILPGGKRLLRCALERGELLERADQLAHCAQRMEAIRQEKAEAAALIGARLKEAEREHEKLARAIRERAEERMVECEIRIDWTAGVHRVVRTDTGETVMQRTVTAEERQQALGDEGYS